MKSVLEIGPIPFHIGMREAPRNTPFPDELPFAAGFDERLGIIAQVPNRDVAAMLDQVYAQGSQLSTPMNEYGLGKATCDDFIGFLLSTLGHPDLSGLRVLEIGCGTGYLITQLKALGANVLGIEPGMKSSVHAERAGIRVIHEPFESVALKGSFDLVLHANVMEHVGTPLEFLRRQLSALGRGGRIALVVPDCDAPVTHGDLSMFVHEHWSYFTRSSVTSLIAAAGGRVVSSRRAGVGGALYAMMEPGVAPAVPVGDSGSDFGSFAQRAERGKEALREFFAARRDRAIGVYCPGRFLNYWRLAGSPHVRFFDDDMALHGRYLPPIPAAVEPRARLLEDPVDSLLIMSRTFGPALAESLGREPALAGREIVAVAELF